MYGLDSTLIDTVDYELLLQMLKDVKRIFAENNIKWCCWCGTLLGAVRDKNFAGVKIDGKFKLIDFDIDLIFFAKDETKFISIFDEFKKLGYKINQGQFYPATFIKEAEWVDFWIFYEPSVKWPNHYFCNAFPFHRKFFDELKIAYIQDVEVPIPNYADELLNIYYGPDWVIPNPKAWSQFLDNPRLYERLHARLNLGL